jgi:hypothetical protein
MGSVKNLALLLTHKCNKKKGGPCQENEKTKCRNQIKVNIVLQEIEAF